MMSDRSDGLILLIVDDDKVLVEKLEETVNWEKCGIQVVLTAFNIRQGEAVLREYPVDLLICDIDMPQGSGLELLEWMRSSGMDTECIFLSSYANFAYAQMALRLSSREYLLKPISNIDLERTIRETADFIYEKKGERKQQNPSKEFWEEFLTGSMHEDRLLKKALSEHLYRETDRICLGTFCISEKDTGGASRKNIRLYDFIVRNVMGEFFEKSEYHLDAVIQTGDLEWRLAFSIRNTGDGLKQDVQTLMEQLMKKVSQNCTIYLSRTMYFRKLKECLSVLEQMERCGVPDENGILYEERFCLQKNTHEAPPWEIWKKQMLGGDSLLPVQRNIEAYVQENGEWTRELLVRLVREFVQLLYVYLSEQDLAFEQIFDNAEFLEYERNASISLREIKHFISYSFEKLEGKRCQDRKQGDVAEQMKVYIDQHLDEELSRSILAKTVFLSEDYVSKVFVKSVGESIPSYITRRRMERAKEYLEKSSLPVNRIALEVGYSNFSYFSKMFRDFSGYTPNEYRSRYGAQNHDKNLS